METIKLFFRAVFTKLYNKPLITQAELENLVALADLDKDGKLSANEVWSFIKSILKKK